MYRRADVTEVKTASGLTEIWDADTLLFSLHPQEDPVNAALIGYNAGLKHGEARGRAYLQFELRRLLGAEPERREP